MDPWSRASAQVLAEDWPDFYHLAPAFVAADAPEWTEILEEWMEILEEASPPTDSVIGASPRREATGRSYGHRSRHDVAAAAVGL